MMNCNECECVILENRCLEKADGRLKKVDLQKHPEIINSVNMLVLIGDDCKNTGLLGMHCYELLCSAIKEAQDQANTFNELNPINPEIPANDPRRFREFYLEDRWNDLLSNKFFIQTYASFCMYYYYALHLSSSETTRDGDVTNDRTGTNNSGQATSNISQDDERSKAGAALATARKYAKFFIQYFLYRNAKNYSCIRPVCGLHYPSSCECTGHYHHYNQSNELDTNPYNDRNALNDAPDFFPNSKISTHTRQRKRPRRTFL